MMGVSPRATPLKVALLIVCAVLACACRSGEGPLLLRLTEVGPVVLSSGDRLEVSGADLPANEARAAAIVLRGELARPGHSPEQIDMSLPGARVLGDRVTLSLTHETVTRFTGEGDDADHATFRGRVDVVVDGQTGIGQVRGTVDKPVVLDFHPPEPRKPVLAARRAEVEQALSFAGLEIDASADGKVTVRDAKKDGPAHRAGLRSGDEIVSFAGVNVSRDTDLLPSGVDAVLPVVIARNDTVIPIDLSLEGYQGALLHHTGSACLVLGTALLVLLLFASPFVRHLAWLRVRIASLAEARWSGEKRRNVIPRTIFSRARSSIAVPFVVAVAVSATFFAVPIFELHYRAEIDLGMCYLLAVVALLSAAALTGGFRAASRHSFFGGIRALFEAAIVVLPSAVSAFAVIVATGSIRLAEIGAAQVGSGTELLDTGSYPWFWFAFRSPALFVAFVVFFLPLLGRSHVATPTLRTRAFHLVEWVYLFVATSLAVALFLGGYQLPGVRSQDLLASPALRMLGATFYLVKCWAFVGIVAATKRALPHVTSAERVRTALLFVLPIGVVAAVGTWVLTTFPPLPRAQELMSTTLFCFSASVLVVAAAGAIARFTRRPGVRGRSLETARVNVLL